MGVLINFHLFPPTSFISCAFIHYISVKNQARLTSKNSRFFFVGFYCIITTIVSHLNKYLKFNSIPGDKNDGVLYKTILRNAMNFRHLFSYDTIERFEIV